MDRNKAGMFQMPAETRITSSTPDRSRRLLQTLEYHLSRLKEILRQSNSFARSTNRFDANGFHLKVIIELVKICPERKSFLVILDRKNIKHTGGFPHTLSQNPSDPSERFIIQGRTHVSVCQAGMECTKSNVIGINLDWILEVPRDVRHN